MWIYKDGRKEAGVVTVGHYNPEGRFIPESDWETICEAVWRINFLNGGKKYPMNRIDLDSACGKNGRTHQFMAEFKEEIFDFDEIELNEKI